jgi:hypothetical protein
MASLFVSAAVLAAAPLVAQPTEPEADGEVNLDAIDRLFGDDQVAGGEDETDDTGEPEATADDGDGDEEAASEADGDEETADEAAAEDTEEREPTDLERALAAYEICASEAGTGLAEQGFSPEQAGQEALLRCSGQRAAYVNAFYFSLLPRYPDASEAEVRASADRLAAQTDNAIAMLVAREVTGQREAEEAAEEADDDMTEDDMPAEADDGTSDEAGADEEDSE